jgi:hypothetical protein
MRCPLVSVRPVVVRSDDLGSRDRRQLRGFELLDKLQRGFASQILSGQATRLCVLIVGAGEECPYWFLGASEDDGSGGLFFVSAASFEGRTGGRPKP